MSRVLLLLFVGIITFAGEWAVLENGSRLRMDRHERDGAIVRLHANGGVTELPASMITSIEVDEVVAQPPAPPQSQTKPATPVSLSPKELVERSAVAHGLPPEFVHLVAKAESAYQVNAVSKAGAIGIMQLMPATAASLGADPNDPEQNVEAGARHLRDLLVQYQNYPDQVQRALAAYNAGAGAVKKYNGVPPYRETQLYVDKIVSEYKRVLDKKAAAK